ncbi:MAG: TIGR04076 family protein [Deltaproteobacteria bacterium]|nr:TIGR04076 family protein [Deltaproteobacteria bacterium]
MAKNEFPGATHKVTATVVEKEGICMAGLKVGDKIVFRIPRIDLRETDGLCMNALACLTPYVRQWSTAPLPQNARPYICCSDPGPEKGGHGHLVFRLEQEPLKKEKEQQA